MAPGSQILSQMHGSFTTHFQLVSHFQTNFLEEFIVMHELLFLSCKIDAHHIRNLCLAHSQMT
jgi:hypothetical protein